MRRIAMDYDRLAKLAEEQLAGFHVSSDRQPCELPLHESAND